MRNTRSGCSAALPMADRNSPMNRLRTYRTEGVVIRQMPLGEADRILTLCSPDMGKVRAVAKGARRMKSRLGGHLELLNRASVSVAMGRNLDTITEASTISAFCRIRDDLRRVSRAMYVAELVDGFSMEGNGNQAMYALLLGALAWLERAANLDLLMRWFEMRLLECAGYMPELVHCVECREWLQPEDHLFACDSGGVLCPNCRSSSSGALMPLPLNTMKTLRFVQREARFDKVEALNAPAYVLNDMERLMRTYIRHIAEREVKSAEFVSIAGADRMNRI